MIQSLVSAKKSIFISHSSADLSAASTLYKELTDNGYTPWMAVRDIPPGANYAEVLSDALDSAAALVVVLTESGIQSPHVKREVNIAIDQGIPLFPVNLSGESEIISKLTKDWKYWLSIVQILNCANAEAACKDLTAAFKRRNLRLTQENKALGNQTPDLVTKNIEKIQDIQKEKQEIEEKLEAKSADTEEQLKKVEPIVIWLAELHQWLIRVATETDPTDEDFDFSIFATSFKEHFHVDKSLYKRFPTDFRLQELGNIAIAMFDTLISFPHLTKMDPDRGKFLLEIAVEVSNPWARLYKGIWLFFRTGVKDGENYFANTKLLDDTLEHFKEVDCSRNEQRIEFAKNNLYDYYGEEFFDRTYTEEDTLEKVHELQSEWKYWHFVTRLASKNTSPTITQRIFQEIDQTLSDDSANLRSKVYLTSSQRIDLKILAACSLFRLERNTAARNVLRSINKRSEDYEFVVDTIRDWHLCSRNESKDFLTELLNVVNENI